VSESCLTPRILVCSFGRRGGVISRPLLYLHYLYLVLAPVLPSIIWAFTACFFSSSWHFLNPSIILEWAFLLGLFLGLRESLDKLRSGTKAAKHNTLKSRRKGCLTFYSTINILRGRHKKMSTVILGMGNCCTWRLNFFSFPAVTIDSRPYFARLIC